MAIEKPHIGKFGPHHVVRVHVEVARADIQTAMHAAIQEISHALAAQDIVPAGSWFAHHYRRPTDTFDFDVCFPVSQQVALSGRLTYELIPLTAVTRTAYHGPYEGLPAAWDEFVASNAAHGVGTREDIFEVYSVGPRERKDSMAWQTDLICPLTVAQKDQEGIA